MPGWKRCAASSTRRARMAGRALPRACIFGPSSSATLKALTRSVALPGARLILCPCAAFWVTPSTKRRRTIDHFPDPAAVLGGDTQSHLPVGGQDSDRRRTDQRPDSFHRCHDAGSQGGHEEYRAARGRSDLPRVSEGAGRGGGDREPYQRTVGAAGSETEKEGLERAMEESRRPD